MATQPETDWIDWTGGIMPVVESAEVEIRMADGETGTDLAGFIDWQHSKEAGYTGSNVVAYRLTGDGL